MLSEPSQTDRCRVKPQLNQAINPASTQGGNEADCLVNEPGGNPPQRQGRRQVKICGVDRHGEREPITGVWRRTDPPPYPSSCKNSSDLYQFQARPLAKVGWTCPPQSTSWRRHCPETTILDDISKFCTEFGHVILRKIVKSVATRCQIPGLKCTEFDQTLLGELTALLQTS